jgi:branched-chain amino acid transport system substrate-binding protein
VASLVVSACGSDDGGGGGSADLGEKNEAAGDPIKIGLFNVEGGSSVSLPAIGDAQVAVIEYANEYLGGLGGRPIEYVRCGDKADGASATACGNQFVSENVVAVVVGQAANSDLLIPILNEAGIVYFGPGINGAAETQTPGLYFVGSGFLGTIAAWAAYAEEQAYDKFAIFLVDNPQATGTVNALGGSLFTAAGAELVLGIIPQGTADASSQVQATLAQEPDAVAIVGDDVVCQAVLNGLITAGNTLPTIVIAPCLSDSIFESLGEDALDGMMIFGGTDLDSDEPEIALYRAVMSTYAPDIDSGGLTTGGYLGTLAFIRAVNAAGALEGDVTADTIRAALDKAVNIPTPLGNGSTFSCDKPQFGAPVVQSTVCSGTFTVAPITGGRVDSTQSSDVDAAGAWSKAFAG